MKKRPYPNRTRGMTLTELLIVMTVMSVIMAGLARFYMDSTLLLFTTEGKLQINANIRKITSEMADNCRNANHFTIYEDFYDSFRSPPPGINHEDYRLHDGESGDVLVLIFYGRDPNPVDSTPAPIERLIGYYRSIDTESATPNTGPVRKFDIMIPASQQNLKVEQLIPDASQISSFSTVIELSRGLANGRLFYNFRDRSIMVNGQIYHGNIAKRITDTYNFTVSPRG